MLPDRAGRRRRRRTKRNPPPPFSKAPPFSLFLSRGGKEDRKGGREEVNIFADFRGRDSTALECESKFYKTVSYWYSCEELPCWEEKKHTFL